MYRRAGSSVVSVPKSACTRIVQVCLFLIGKEYMTHTKY